MAKPTYHDTVEAAHLCYIARLLAENERLRARVSELEALLRDIEDSLSHARKSIAGEWIPLNSQRPIVSEIRAALAVSK